MFCRRDRFKMERQKTKRERQGLALWYTPLSPASGRLRHWEGRGSRTVNSRPAQDTQQNYVGNIRNKTNKIHLKP